MTTHDFTADLTVAGQTIGGYHVTRDAAGRILSAAFWGVAALLAADAEMNAAACVASEAPAVETVGVVME